MGQFILLMLCVGFIQTDLYAKSCESLFAGSGKRLKTYDYIEANDKIDFSRGHVFEHVAFELASNSYIMVVYSSKKSAKKIDRYRFDSENENIYLEIINYILHFRKMGLDRTPSIRLSGYFTFKTEIKFGKNPSRSIYPVFIIDHLNIK